MRPYFVKMEISFIIHSPARDLRETAPVYAAEKNIQRSINTIKEHPKIQRTHKHMWKSSAHSRTTFFVEKFDLCMKQQFFMDTLKENFT